jgi:chromosome segregation protein
MLIKEVILENFMSYDYARISFRPGVNVICGPNGSGKSSLLLAISVCLGQSYTERARRLRDLIRWGRDQARITLVLDNSKRGGRRPVPKFKKDQIFLTRVLRKDGNYWFSLENRAATKQEVQRVLSKLGVNPDNMLIIMHQNMVEQFTVLSSQEKLRMVEAAVGMESYRKNVLQAQKKLSRILSQEESVKKLLESAEETLNYWREQYDRYQQKKQLLIKRRFLERELAWAEVQKREETVEEIKNAIKNEEASYKEVEEQIQNLEKRQIRLQEDADTLKAKSQKLYEEHLTLEREKARQELSLSLCTKLLKEVEQLQPLLLNPKNSQLTLPQTFELLRIKTLKEKIGTANEQINKLANRINEVRTKTHHLLAQLEKINEAVVDCKINMALLRYRKESMEKTLKKLNRQLRSASLDLKEAIKRAEEKGSRIVSVRNIIEILDEIRTVDGHLAVLADVSEDVEKMYESYSKLYLELKEKARLVAENREKAMEEVKTRMEAWKTVIQSLLDKVSLQYQKILLEANAIGEVKLINENDIEAAGLELLVGFKGASPVPLNAYTQSGGERSTATMSFLLALQQHIRSPFRAVDEFDIHMDPRNRETIAKTLISAVGGSNAQYLIITPSQVTFAREGIHVITVQNVEGTSIIREVA